MLPSRKSVSNLLTFSYGGCVLGALLIADDGIRNEGVWAALGQSLGFMFSQYIDGYSC